MAFVGDDWKIHFKMSLWINFVLFIVLSSQTLRSNTSKINFLYTLEALNFLGTKFKDFTF